MRLLLVLDADSSSQPLLIQDAGLGDLTSLRATLEMNSDDRLRIAFNDTGRGMSPEQVEHLFEPFSSTTGGTGLGLSIVYQIIRDHGGTINVRSRVGQGTTITVELPVAAKNGDLAP